jgi:demethylmenaquinone methyltransferase/2-methoxy-6-polyprenyl-1,4-benzoquinol methylase
MNDLMSLGVHRYWKHRAIEMLDVESLSNLQVLDLAGGTGDLSVLLSKKLGADSRVVLADINYAMVSVGRNQRIDQGYSGKLDFTIANAEQLPYPDASFDRLIIGFGLRNVTDKQKALDEMFRVLKPQGRMLILEFSKVQNELLAKAYDWYSFSILPILGKIITNDAESYQYLAESIRKHPDQQELLSMIERSGFSERQYENFLQGMVAIHTAIK